MFPKANLSNLVPRLLTLSPPRASEDEGKMRNPGNEIVDMRDDVLLLQAYDNFLGT